MWGTAKENDYILVAMQTTASRILISGEIWNLAKDWKRVLEEEICSVSSRPMTTGIISKGIYPTMEHVRVFTVATETDGISLYVLQ